MEQPPAKKLKQHDPECLLNECLILINECEENKLSNRNLDTIFNEFKRLHGQKSTVDNSISDDKIVIAFFGGPGKGKSSSINFMLCGNFEYPLINSSKSGTGVTKTPVRCEYQNKCQGKFIFEFYKDNQVVNTETIDRNGLKDILEKANCDQYDEILLQAPIEIKPINSPFPNNIQFIDLIGTPEINLDSKEESFSVKKNRNTIKKRDIDCVFIFADRNNCNTDIIKHMWEIDVFTNLKDKIKPKLVMFELVREWKLEDYERKQKLEGLNEDECRRSLQVSLTRAFDFEILTEINSKQRDQMRPIEHELPIMHKSIVIPELYQKCEANFMLVSKEAEIFKIEKISLNKMKSLIESVLRQHINSNNIRLLEIGIRLIVDLEQKLKSKRYGQMRNNCFSKKLIKFFYDNKTYENMISSMKKCILDSNSNTKNYVFFDDIMEVFDENFDYNDDDSIQCIYEIWSFERIEYRINEVYYELIKSQMENFLNFIKNLKGRITNYLKRFSFSDLKIDELDKVFSNFNDEYFRWLIENELNECLKGDLFNYIHKRENHIDESFDKADKSLLRLVDELRGNIIEKSTDSNINCLLELEKKLCCKKEEMKKIITQIVSTNRDDEQGYYDVRKPQLYMRPNSLKFPDRSVEVTTLDECFKNRWLQTQKDHLKGSDLFSEGSQKSKILENNQLEINNLTPSFRDEIEKLQLDTAIQIEIDRKNKRIKFECDISEINRRIENIMKGINDEIDELCTHLYPIFISSRLRGHANDYTCFRPNTFVKDFCRNGSHLKNMMIFLFIEGGTVGNRGEFDQEIDFYKELRRNDYESCQKKLDQNPIVLCFLPERNLGIGRKRKLMMLFAEKLKLNRFYVCDDDIDTFNQYDSRPHVNQMRSHPLAACKAFSYMSKVMDFAFEDKDVSDTGNKIVFNDEKREDFIGRFYILKKDLNENQVKATKQIQNILIDKQEHEKKETLFYLLGQIGEPVKEIATEIKECLLSEKAKILGQVGLWNQGMNSLRETFTSRLQGNNRTTHALSKIRYQIVLYNTHALKGIHPVSDAAFFEIPLKDKERIDMVQKIKNKKFDDRDARKAARLGYKFSDNAHAYYQIMNHVTGYLIYYFSFNCVKNAPSKVNADETQADDY